ncbi:MAG: tRNA pseudouridine(38-40) synthase TruA [Candidatus Eisenbacteria bacterium]
MNGGRRYRVTLAYDGTDFHGWQRQPELRTVQGELEHALHSVFGVEVTVHGAGRTDAGVHARGQVASFSAATDLPTHALRPLVGRAMPRDVRVLAIDEAAPGFHARHTATARHYSYRILDEPDVLFDRVAWHPLRRRPVHLERLDAAVQPLLGEHDCTAFQATGSSSVDPDCRIEKAAWRRWEGGMLFEVQADHFLYHMVRKLVGTALHAADQKDPAGLFEAVLASRDRARSGPMAPAKGLCLEAVLYEGEESCK